MGTPPPPLGGTLAVKYSAQAGYAAKYDLVRGYSCRKVFYSGELGGKVPPVLHGGRESFAWLGAVEWGAFWACFYYRLPRGVTMPTLLGTTYLTQQPK